MNPQWIIKHWQYFNEPSLQIWSLSLSWTLGKLGSFTEFRFFFRKFLLYTLFCHVVLAFMRTRKGFRFAKSFFGIVIGCGNEGSTFFLSLLVGLVFFICFTTIPFPLLSLVFCLSISAESKMVEKLLEHIVSSAWLVSVDEHPWPFVDSISYGSMSSTP